MPKRIRTYPTYIAPQMIGIRKNGPAIVRDMKTGKNLDPSKIDDKITIYERQVKDWFLNKAKWSPEKNNRGFIALMIAIAHIEGVEQYIRGESSRRHSRDFFISGMKRIFDVRGLDSQLSDFYDQVRCGLFHNGMTEHPVLLQDDILQPIDFSEADTIKINIRLFINMVLSDFNRYIKALKDPKNKELRENFNEMFKLM